ncbi:MAG: type II toxin-antitoxin system VapC family toxin [Oscillospiraceae bacterium]|nr:type II toxin-antitoxin system VapC family toxin [Oscillospiraceae bacterium]MCL2279566.1 type II toxin-antitoxin system VapC family toxin [Oscillospiraceae bacterium]
MKYLLDTHTLIWLIEASSKVSEEIKNKLKFPGNTVYLSSASLWEIAIKSSLGKLELRKPFDDLLADLESTDIVILQIEGEYLRMLKKLPLLHKDPFDRLIISTALVEELTIITTDENIKKYDTPWDW